MMRPSPTRRAFSLIEVLVSVVVLALGLLGLAAVFPTVVRQQRLASDGVEGASLERSIREWVVNHAALNAPIPSTASPNQAGLYQVDDLRGWSTLTCDPEWSPVVNTNFSDDPTFWSYEGEWSVPSVLPPGSYAGGITIASATGDMMLGNPAGSGVAAFEGGVPIPLVERLIPSPDMDGSVTPRFVFDFAARRIDLGNQRAANGNNQNWVNVASQDDRVEVAVFVRRIDSSIRVPRGATLTQVILGRNVAAAERRVPVAADGVNRPTNDGFGMPTSLNYSGLVQANFALADVLAGEPTVRTNRIVVAPAAGVTQPDSVRAMVGLLEQVGQKLVAPDGTVHTVRAYVDSQFAGNVTARVLMIEPALSGRVLELAQADPSKLQMVASPQVPAAVVVVRP